MKIFFGNDHAGFSARDELLTYLNEQGHDVEDVGTSTDDRVDYPDFASQVAQKVQATPDSVGVLVCGSGIGMSMTANRLKGVRAALVLDEYSAEMSRKHNNANIICLRSREIPAPGNTQLLDLFLKTDFEGGRHEKRVEKIDSAC
jgi:ribose 5-phosphate isomerase B